MLVSGRVGIALSKANSEYNPSPQLPIFKAIIGVITQYIELAAPPPCTSFRFFIEILRQPQAAQGMKLDQLPFFDLLT